jgi:peptidoglycan/xylan/chitin deacetylase (PgdA/CDA1 family)
LGGFVSRHIACITFDFDAMSGFIARGMTSPTAISRGEFGAIGVGRILALHEKYRIPATFYIPGVVIGTYPDICQQIARAGHEIGHHGWTHVPPASLAPEQEEQGIIRGIEAIQHLTGAAPRGYRSPAWDLSQVTVELLLRHGFLYDSSMMGNDHRPYRVRLGDRIQLEEPVVFGRETDLVEMPISWTLDDFPHFEYLRTPTAIAPGLMNASHVLENWLGDFDYMVRTTEWGVLTYTCHPYVIGRGHRMLMLERLLLNLRERNATFQRVEDAAREYVNLQPGGSPDPGAPHV